MLRPFIVKVSVLGYLPLYVLENYLSDSMLLTHYKLNTTQYEYLLSMFISKLHYFYDVSILSSHVIPDNITKSIYSSATGPIHMVTELS